MKVSVIIPAGGSGVRFGNLIPKQLVLLDDKPIIVHTIQAFEIHPLISSVILSVAENWIDRYQELILLHNLSKVTTITIGGNNRQTSIANALFTSEALSSDIVLVHDSVRPFISQNLISTVVSTAIQSGAAIPVLNCKETIKLVNSNGIVIQTLDRNLLRSVQTPQGFKRDILVSAYNEHQINSMSTTDDASLVEAIGIQVSTISGEESNIKITTPLDFKLAELILSDLKIQQHE
ncbi:MAG: 2-C-methyl-D-erythritol 4-phosphate cytidylyltransferase [Ignavibacteria bacterium]|nr:2-C-methyl-D-erythritol 4-phosphate cytidylyltransferase [Ignavibacteria bacterium]